MDHPDNRPFVQNNNYLKRDIGSKAMRGKNIPYEFITSPCEVG